MIMVFKGDILYFVFLKYHCIGKLHQKFLNLCICAIIEFRSLCTYVGGAFSIWFNFNYSYLLFEVVMNYQKGGD
jgi:hypothetical protein